MFLLWALLVALVQAQRCTLRQNATFAALNNPYATDFLSLPVDDSSGVLVPGCKCTQGGGFARFPLLSTARMCAARFAFFAFLVWSAGIQSMLFNSYNQLRYWSTANGTTNVLNLTQSLQIPVAPARWSVPVRASNGVVTFAQLLGNGTQVIQHTATVQGNVSLTSVTSVR